MKLIPASSVEITDTPDFFSEGDERVLRLVLRNPMHDSSLYNFINSVRQQIAELRLVNATELTMWVEQIIVPRVQHYLEEHPEISRLLEENARIELSLNGSLVASHSDPIVMIIDRWATQTPENALVSSILYPASIPMRGDECDYQDVHQLRRLALSSMYGNPLACHHLAMWAYLNQPDTYGLPRYRELFNVEILYKEALKIFDRCAINNASVAATDFQRRTLLLCRRDLRPETTQRTPLNLTLSDENQDSRLLFNIGITGTKNNKESLLKSRRAGFLKARFHETRYMKNKQTRAQELQRLKRDLAFYESRSSLHVGKEMIDAMKSEVDKDLVRVGNINKICESSSSSDSREIVAALSDFEVGDISKTIFEIINKNA